MYLCLWKYNVLAFEVPFSFYLNKYFLTSCCIISLYDVSRATISMSTQTCFLLRAALMIFRTDSIKSTLSTESSDWLRLFIFYSLLAIKDIIVNMWLTQVYHVGQIQLCHANNHFHCICCTVSISLLHSPNNCSLIWMISSSRLLITVFYTSMIWSISLILIIISFKFIWYDFCFNL